MSSVSVCRANGGGLTGYGCVSAARSPSSDDAGTLRYSIGKERLARLALEHVDVAGLRDLRDGVHRPAIARHGHEHRRRGEIPIPEVVLHALEMPDALARPRVEREHGVGEQVVAEPVRAIKVERRRARRGEDHRAFCIDGHAGPRVRAAVDLVRLGQPRLVAEFARMRNRVKAPAQRAGLEVVGADVAGRPGSVSLTVLPMMSISSKTTPGVLALTDSDAAGRPSPSRRSTAPSTPNDGMGFPVFLSSAQSLLR